MANGSDSRPLIYAGRHGIEVERDNDQGPVHERVCILQDLISLVVQRAGFGRLRDPVSQPNASENSRTALGPLRSNPL